MKNKDWTFSDITRQYDIAGGGNLVFGLIKDTNKPSYEIKMPNVVFNMSSKRAVSKWE